MRNRSVIVDLFQGQQKSSLKCLKCGLQSHRFEPFMYLSVPLQDCQEPKQFLEDCIREYCSEEKMVGDERWKCPQCRSPQESVKKIDLWSLPNILIIHLKRF